MKFQITKNIQLVLGLKFIVGRLFLVLQFFCWCYFPLTYSLLQFFFFLKIIFVYFFQHHMFKKSKIWRKSNYLSDISVKVPSRACAQSVGNRRQRIEIKSLVIRLNKQTFYSVGWHCDPGSAVSLSFMSTCSSTTFLDCQSTSKMYCLDLGRISGLHSYFSTVMRYQGLRISKT